MSTIRPSLSPHIPETLQPIEIQQPMQSRFPEGALHISRLIAKITVPLIVALATFLLLPWPIALGGTVIVALLSFLCPCDSDPRADEIEYARTPSSIVVVDSGSPRVLSIPWYRRFFSPFQRIVPTFTRWVNRWGGDPRPRERVGHPGHRSPPAVYRSERPGAADHRSISPTRHHGDRAPFAPYSQHESVGHRSRPSGPLPRMESHAGAHRASGGAAHAASAGVTREHVGTGNRRR